MEKGIVIAGPTASGKTALAVAVAKAVQGEVICADSMQVYREMPIASAAATQAEQAGVPHHLLSFLDPAERFSVADYVPLAQKAAADILKRGKVPVFCGGTGLFLDALFQNLQFSPGETDLRLRERLMRQAAACGNAAMHDSLRVVDPKAAERIHPNDSKRVIRALEVYYTTGTPLSVWEERSRSRPGWLTPLWIALNYQDRSLLYERINARVDRMMAQGLLEEARRLNARKDAATCRQAIGHKELDAYLNGQCPLEEAVSRLKQETRRYAKRQLTWLRRNQEIHWFYPDENPECTAQVIRLAQRFLREEL